MAHMIGVHVPVCLHLLMATGTVGAARKGHSRDRHFAGYSQLYPLSPDRVLRLRVRPYTQHRRPFARVSIFNEIGIYDPQNPIFFLASQGRTVTGAEA